MSQGKCTRHRARTLARGALRWMGLGALALGCGVTQACDTATARGTVEGFLDEVLGPQCGAYLATRDDLPEWRRACAVTQAGDQREIHVLFRRMTRITVKAIETRAGGTVAVLSMRGPDPLRFAVELIDGYCATPMALGQWDRPDDTGLPRAGDCDANFWSRIPIIEYTGTVPLTCVGGQWRVGDLRS